MRLLISSLCSSERVFLERATRKFSDVSVTTEQALRRLELLGYTIEDACIQRAVSYMTDCLTGAKTIPDRPEKVSDWHVFSSLILSTWILRFVPDHRQATQVARQWAEVTAQAFMDGMFDRQRYVQAYKAVLQPAYGRINGMMTFYPLSLLRDSLDEQTEKALIRYALDHPQGIYYISDRKISEPPAIFEGRETSRYLAALELLARYSCAGEKLQFAAEWLHANADNDGKWDLGSKASDKMYFPLSDDWRKKETRISDCTERIEKLLKAIETKRNA